MAYPNLNILCVCLAGRVRSHALRMFIADNYIKTSVIAAGVIDHRHSFLPSLLKKADAVIACAQNIEELLLNKFGCRAFLIDIGNDVYCGPDDERLRVKIELLSSEIEFLINNTRAMKSLKSLNSRDIVNE